MTINALRLRLGDMLIQRGVISEEQLKLALDEQKRSGLRLGKALIKLNFITDVKLCELLAHQFSYPRYLPENYPFDPGIVDLLSADVAKRCNVVPLGKTETGQLEVAMVDPMDVNAFDVIENEVDMMISPVLCTESELDQLFNAVYGGFKKFNLGVSNSDETESPVMSGVRDDEVLIGASTGTSEEEPVIQTVNWVLSEAILRGASDIHLSPEKDHVQLRMRIDGRLRDMPAPPSRLFSALVSRIKVLSRMDISRQMVAQDGRFSVKVQNKEVNVRVSTVPTINGENVVMRLLDNSEGIRSIDHLGLPPRTEEAFEKLVQLPHGMILVTGPTGSGKSTTLYSVLSRIASPELNIMTVEDPVEYRMRQIRQVQLNEKAGMTFASSLRSLLRQDPDVLMVGEIRDGETAAISCRSALTGHLVLSTVHTNNAVGAIGRLEDMGVAPFIIASTLNGVMAQRLVRRLCPACKQPHANAEEVKQFWRLADTAEVFQATGCQECMNTGYRGRTGLFELLVVDNEVKRWIFDKMTAAEITRQALEKGKLFTLAESARFKLAQGITSPEEVISQVMDVDDECQL